MSPHATPLSAQPARAASAVTYRVVKPVDEVALHTFLAGLSVRSVRQRFWSAGVDRARIARRLAHGGCGVVACEDRGTIIGHAECLPIEPDLAEVAVVVADDHQGRGIGAALIDHLAVEARAVGVTRFLAHVSPKNTAMLQVFTRAFGAAVREVGEECQVSFAAEPRPRVTPAG